MLRRADGRSVYTPHDRARYTTRPHLDAEEQLVAAAGRTGGPGADPGQAGAALGASPAELASLPGWTGPQVTLFPATATAEPEGRSYAGGLRADQAAAVYGILTSGRPVDVLIGPAGTGKSCTMGTLAQLWRACTGGQVVGVATSENAAQVLAAEIGQARNIARFLAQAAHGQAVLSAGDLLIVDEAGMVDTAQLTALYRLADAAGAKMLLVGDPAQLPAVGAGGLLGLLARQYGHWQLTQVQRMDEPWEQEASLRLRAGDAGVLADYDTHGRLTDGTTEEMTTAAYRSWLADHLAGRDSLLLATTAERAAELAGRARADLVALGQVAPEGIRLRDGNTAGVGDLVQARRNEPAITEPGGRWAANRDVWRIVAIGYDPDIKESFATVRRYLGRGPDGEREWSDPFEVSQKYLQQDVELAYASTVHAAQGRTVDTCHALAEEGLARHLLYVMMTRGRSANYAYVPLQAAGGHRPAHVGDTGQRVQRRSTDLRPGTSPATASQHDDGQAGEPSPAREPVPQADPTAPWAPEADRLSVLAAALERDSTEPPALDVLHDEQARTRHLAHIGAIWVNLAAEASSSRYEATLREVLTPEQYQRLSVEDARSTLYRRVRMAELAGHDPARLLAAAVRLRSLDVDPHRGRADNIAEVLHYRVGEITGDVVPRPASYVSRTPAADDPQIHAYLLALARLRDQRAAELGEQAADHPPTWASDPLGPVPYDPQQRAGWARRAGIIAAYREQYGHHGADPIGREPAAPEARADWHDAYQALGRPAAQLAITAASDGELLARQARYERELAWAPPHVGAELRQTAIARREHTTEATLTRAQARTRSGPGREELVAQAHGHDRLAETLADRERALAGQADERARWYESTTQIREQAAEAHDELRRRWPHAGHLPHPQAEPEQRPQRETDQQPEPQQAAPAEQLSRATQAAERARRELERQAAERQAGDQRRRDEPAPARWPERDPGYPQRQPAPGRHPAQLAAQDHPDPHRSPTPSPPNPSHHTGAPGHHNPTGARS